MSISQPNNLNYFDIEDFLSEEYNVNIKFTSNLKGLGFLDYENYQKFKGNSEK